MTKIAILLIVILGVVVFAVFAFSGDSKNNSPLLLSQSTPMRVTIPALSISSTLTQTGVKPDGSLAVPPLSTPMQASWWNGSPMPGAIGPAVVLGHINGGGKPGIFLNLDKVQAGQEVLVDRADGQTAVFTVSHVDTVPKAEFPASTVYGDTPDSELRVITCGGDLDRQAHHYDSNVIVYANLTSVRKT